jgi:hypothetical protein
MKNILKLLMVFVLPLFLLNSCRDEANKDWTNKEQSINLYNTTLSSNTLYPSMADNTFRLTWDAPSGTASSYTVQMSTTADFAKPVALGTATTNIFTTKIATLNMALLQANYSPYTQTLVYLRVISGTSMSNVINVGVTPYPVAVPVITNPIAGQAIVLDAANPTVVATTVKWTDYEYGVNAMYTVEIAKKGSTTFAAAGSTVKDKELKWTNFDLNTAVLKLEFPAGVATEISVRVAASTTSAGGIIKKVSEIVNFKVTPYEPPFSDFYLVGGGTAVGWNAGASQMLYRTNEVTEIYTYLQNDGEFRFLGQQDWNPINYSLKTDAIRDDYKYFKTWSNNLTTAGNENIKFNGDSGIYKIKIDQNTRDITITPSVNSTIPTNVYLVGSIQGWNAGSALEMTQVGDGVYEYMIAIPANGEFKFIGQQDWSGLEWGNIRAAGNSGFLGPNGDNNNIKYPGNGGMYKITANIKMGTYKVTPQ